MTKGFRRFGVLATLTVLSGVLVGSPSPAQAQQTLTVDVGARLFELPQAQGAPADGMRFYAPELNVHQGDTLHFNMGFHTATAIPAGEDVNAWLGENVFSPTGEYTVAVPDPDDGALKFNNRVFLPSDPTCGGPGAPPCIYDGSSVVNSGVVFPEFSMVVNAAPNQDFWIVCLIHPSMVLHVNVVPPSQAATTQAEVDSYKEEQTVIDARAARETHERFIDRHRKRDGAWQAWAGIDGEGFALFAMYPRRLSIAKGERVQWHFNLIHEIHTVTLPLDKAKAQARRFGQPFCDPDGDSGSGPDNPPDTPEPPFCHDPSQLELDLPLKIAESRGDGTFKGGDYENSGIVGPGGDDYTLRFARRSPDKGFKYICLVHGAFMSAKVFVR